MRIPIFHVDVFTDRPFSGNPAAVCLLDSWLDDALLRKVAAENNLSATAFLVPAGGNFDLRWFTTHCEIRLCGHATLAAGYLVLSFLQTDRQIVRFATRSGGILSVQNEGEIFSMDLPAFVPRECANVPPGLSPALGPMADPTDVLEVNDTYVAVFENAGEIEGLNPNVALLEQLHPFVVAVTAPGEREDFVSRYFAPSYGVPEDPVTGSAHCVLTPYWTKRLGKSRLHARQLSRRGGELWCEMEGERVILQGKAVLTLEGSLTI